MEKIFNLILIIGVLIALYFSIQRFKQDNKSEKFYNIETFNMDKIYKIDTDKPEKIQFDYDFERAIDKQFLKEQEQGAFMSTWYPNTWIEKIGSDGKPIYNSRENVTKNKEEFIEPKARFNYKFDELGVVQMDGIADPTDFKDGNGRTLAEVYDNSFVDFKKLTPKKKVVQSGANMTYMSGASNLDYIIPDEWVYENEKPENGGEISSGLYASDPETIGSVALF
jgi:hypothetical protein